MSVLTEFDPSVFGPKCEALLRRAAPLAVGQSRPQQELAADLERVAADLIGRAGGGPLASCCAAGLWLRFGFLDRSHDLSQQIETVEGCYWHAIMHRHEPDYSNAKYWFRQIGRHPVFDSLAEASRLLAVGHPLDSHCEFLDQRGGWDSLAAVDWCAAVAAGRSDSTELCRTVLLREWELLFDYCYRTGATGSRE